MSEQGDFELFSGPQPKEQSEASDEQFREEMKKTQKAIKDLKQEEGHAKDNDNSLAGIIVQFLSQPQNTDLFLLISRAVAQNIPSELIIAILSLVDKKAQEETVGLLETSKEQKALTLHQKADFESLDPELKKAIDQWVHALAKVASNKPHRTLEAIVIQAPQRHLSPVLVQLSTFILRRFLLEHQKEVDFQPLHDFMQKVWVGLLKSLETLVQEQKQVSSG